MEHHNQIEISVIIPALNEEENILTTIDNTLKTLEEFNLDGEIIVINDGSRDKTEYLVEQILKKNSRVRMIKHEFPQGIGMSFWDGVDCASGNSVVMLPGDNESNPREILRYYRLLEQVDIVIPFVFNKEVRSPLRNTVSSVYRFIINTTFRVNFNYTNGTVLYRKCILRELDYRSRDFFFQTDILIRTVKRGYLFAEVPYKLGLRKGGVSKAFSFASLLKVIKSYLRLVGDYYFKNGKKNKKCFINGSLTALRCDDYG